MLIRNATILSMDPEIGDVHGDVLVEGDRIAAVGPDLAAPASHDVLDATGALVLPGFVDTHRHMWEGALRGSVTGGTLDDYFHRILLGVAPGMTPEDLAVSEALSARASLDAGITTVQDTSDIHAGPERTDAIVDALRSSGLRAVLAYGKDRPSILREGSGLPADARRVRSALLPDDDALVTMALSTSHGSDDDERQNAELARELGVRTAHHVRAGITPARLHRLGALRPGTTFVHGNGLDRTDLELIRDSGGTLSIAPLVEDALGLGRPMIAEARAAGVPVALSIDIEATAPTDMFTQMRALYTAARVADPQAAPGLREIVRHATVDGAWALGLDDRTGSIAPGKQADLVVLGADRADVTPVLDPYATVVLQMDRSHVDTVLVAGRVHRRGGRPVTDDTDLRHRATAVARRLALPAAAPVAGA